MNLEQIRADIAAHEAEGRDMSVRRELVSEVARQRESTLRLLRELDIVRGMLAEGRNAGHDIRTAALEAENYIVMLLDDGNWTRMVTHDTLQNA
jgi:hypothetical protein